MTQLAKKHTSRSDEITGRITDWQNYFSENVRLFYLAKRFVFERNLRSDEITQLATLGKPDLECNVLEAYLARLLGEFVKQEPSFRAMDLPGDNTVQPEMLEFYEGKIRYTWHEANNQGLTFKSYQNSLGGGYFAWQVNTDYESWNTLEQKIWLEHITDVGLVFFDPMARLPHKGDGQFCGRFVPLTLEEAKKEFPNADIDWDNLKFGEGGSDSQVTWAYKNGTKKIVMVCYYYEKKRKPFTLVRLTDGSEMDEADYEKKIEAYRHSLEFAKTSPLGVSVLAQPPQIKAKRQSSKPSIIRYTLINKQVIDKDNTDYTELPIIFGDGNSVELTEDSLSSDTHIVSRQVTRPYLYHAMDAQRTKNFCLQTMAQQVQQMTMSKYMAPMEGMTDDIVDEWLKPQKPGLNLYRMFDPRNPDRQLEAPSPLEQRSLSTEILALYEALDSTIQQIQGSYDAALGINNNQLSGEAIFQGATQSNSVSIPYVVNFVLAMNQAAKVICGLIPKIFITPRSHPIRYADGSLGYMMVNTHPLNQLEQTQDRIKVEVEAGVNFEIQKSRSISALVQLGQAYPAINQMMSQAGLPYIFDNIDVRNGDELKEIAKEWTEQQKQMAQQQQQQQQGLNPLMLKAQEIQQAGAIKTQELKLKAQEQIIEQQSINQKAQDSLLKASAQAQYNDIQNKRADADIMAASREQAHRHANDLIKNSRENIKTAHQVTQDLINTAQNALQPQQSEAPQQSEVPNDT